MLLALTRRPAPLGIGFRVDAGCVDIIGINGMPRITNWGTWEKTFMTLWAIVTSVVVVDVRLGPTVAEIVPVLTPLKVPPAGIQGAEFCVATTRPSAAAISPSRSKTVPPATTSIIIIKATIATIFHFDER